MNETIDFYSFEVVVKLKTSAINTNGKIDILFLYFFMWSYVYLVTYIFMLIKFARSAKNLRISRNLLHYSSLPI